VRRTLLLLMVHFGLAVPLHRQQKQPEVTQSHADAQLYLIPNLLKSGQGQLQLDADPPTFYVVFSVKKSAAIVVDYADVSARYVSTFFPCSEPAFWLPCLIFLSFGKFV
jgi:hypothetical protein